MHRDEGLSFADVVTFNLDEYYPMPKESIHSYHRFMWENLFSHIDIKPGERPHPAGRRVRAREIDEAAQRVRAGDRARRRNRLSDSRHRQDGTHRLQRARLGRGQPHAPRDARRRDAPRRRGRFLRRGVRAARGDHDGRRDDSRRARDRDHRDRRAQSRASSQRAVEGEIDVEVAATFLQRHPNTTFYVDRAAAAELTRIKTPWLIDEVQWTQELIVRAVIWLSQRTDKAILKLTQRDYADARMSSLVAKFGSPGEVNGKVFNVLGAKIRGKSKLPIGPADHLLLAAPRRRRHLDGRHSPQADRERQRRSSSRT